MNIQITKLKLIQKLILPKKISIVVLLVLTFSFWGAAYACDCDKKYTGRYYWGAETNSFQSCNEGKAYWVSISTWNHDPLLAFVKKSVKEPYQAVYIEFKGHLLNEGVNGFAKDYDGLIRISKITSMSATIPTQCQKK